jgi:D-3-phosphoglycerate dehydrogenase
VIELFGSENVLLVTARPAASAEMTLGWLRQHGFPECEVIFSDEKASIATAYGCAYAVEDSERHARGYAAAGITCFLIGAEGNGHGPVPGIERFRDLDGVLDGLEAVTERRRAGMPLNGNRGLTFVPRRPKIVVSDAIHPAARAALA